MLPKGRVLINASLDAHILWPSYQIYCDWAQSVVC